MRIEKLDYTSQPAEPAFDYCFDAGRNQYWMLNQRGSWIGVNETQFKRALRQRGVSPHVSEGFVSPLDNAILETQNNRDVHYAGPLGGHRSGLAEAQDRRVLITESPRIIEPVRGDFHTLKALFHGLFYEQEHNQIPYIYGWLKVACESLRSGVHRPGQALVLAGKRGCGKSLMQNLITCILGGRSARPYQFMSGSTPFNADLFAAEHLMIEDEQASTDIRVRRNFGTSIKGITVNQWQRCHGKNRMPITLSPFWRLSVTVNDEPENLMVLPPLDDSMEDKLIVLRANRFEFPMPTVSVEERAAFWNTLISELPAFLYFLTVWQIPENLVNHRFGITHFHHPEIVESIDTMAPEFRLLRLMDDELFQGLNSDHWEGTAEQLERRLCEESSSCRFEARKLFTYNTACGVYLGRLQKRDPQRFQMIKTSRANVWRIMAGIQD